jgi:hypothetical protein
MITTSIKVMKKMMLLIILTGLSLTAVCQRSPVDDLFDKYNGREGFTSVYISSRMFSLLGNIDTEDKEFENIVSRIKSIKILAIDSAHNVAGISFIGELQKKLNSSGYEELMTVKEENDEIRFMIREVNGKITELIMITGGNGSSVVSITGDLDLKTIASLSENIGIEGLEDLEKVRQ